MGSVDELPPAATDAERYCIGCIARFQNDTGELFKLLKPADLTDERNKRIFAAAAQQLAVGEIDPILLGRACDETGYLAEVGSEVATRAHIPSEAAKIIEARDKRRLYIIGRDAMQAASNSKPAETIRRGLLAELEEITREATAGKRLLSDLMPASQFVKQNHTIEYLIPYNIVAGQPGVFSAKAKSLKTALIYSKRTARAVGLPTPI